MTVADAFTIHDRCKKYARVLHQPCNCASSGSVIAEIVLMQVSERIAKEHALSESLCTLQTRSVIAEIVLSPISNQDCKGARAVPITVHDANKNTDITQCMKAHEHS